MNTLIPFFIFFIILFLYIHVIHQYKTSQDLEIYEMDYKDNKQLQEVCDVKQPVLFEFESIHPSIFENITKDAIFTKYGSYDVKMKDIRDYYKNNKEDSDSNIGSYVVLSLQSSQNLIKSDPNSNYFSENNEEFIEETGLYGICKSFDEYLKPTFICQTKYDFLFGSTKSYTPLRYHMNYRQYYIVHTGKIQVKMTPWKSKKYLKPSKDYENYEFRSPINVWNPQSEYLHEMDKLHFLEFEVNSGNVLYIPQYWWYSIKYIGENETVILGITYNSIMNCIAHLPQWGLYFLQQQNITKKISRIHPITKTEESQSNENNDENNNEENNTPTVVTVNDIVDKL